MKGKSNNPSPRTSKINYADLLFPHHLPPQRVAHNAPRTQRRRRLGHFLFLGKGARAGCKAYHMPAGGNAFHPQGTDKRGQQQGPRGTSPNEDSKLARRSQLAFLRVGLLPENCLPLVMLRLSTARTSHARFPPFLLLTRQEETARGTKLSSKGRRGRVTATRSAQSPRLHGVSPRPQWGTCATEASLERELTLATKRYRRELERDNNYHWVVPEEARTSGGRGIQTQKSSKNAPPCFQCSTREGGLPKTAVESTKPRLGQRQDHSR